MKSNQIIAQNQRVKQITPTTVVVGIDIGKEKHVAQATNFRGIVLTKRAWTFSNTVQGFGSLLDQIQGVQRDHGLDRLVVGMESTGHYFWNLAHWLRAHGVEVVIVNPATTKRNKGENSLKPGGTYSQDFGLIIYGYQFTKGSYRIVKTYSTTHNHKEIPISAKFQLH